MGNSSSFRHSNPYYRTKMCIDIEQKIISNIIRLEPFTCTHCDMGSVPLASLGLQSNFSLVAAASATRQAVGTASWWGIPVLGIKDRDCKRSVYTTNPRKLYSKYTGDLEWGLWLQTSCIHQWWLAPTQENSIQNIQGIWNERNHISVNTVISHYYTRLAATY